MEINKKLKTRFKFPVSVVQLYWTAFPETWNDFLEEYHTSFLVIAIDAWLKENCEYGYERCEVTVKFESESDAALFKLSWTP